LVRVIWPVSELQYNDMKVNDKLFPILEGKSLPKYMLTQEEKVLAIRETIIAL
jgi:hypothetical protein